MVSTVQKRLLLFFFLVGETLPLARQAGSLSSVAIAEITL